MKVFSGSIGGSHSLIADDTAANYSSFNNTPANGGYGFDGWSIAPVGGGGVFRAGVGSGFGNINTGGNSFGAYSGTTAGTDGVNCQRNLKDRGLTVGFALSGVCAVNFRNGGKGFSAYTDMGYSTEVFNMNVGNPGGADGYYVNGSNQNVDYRSDMIIRVVLRQVTTTAFSWEVNYSGTTPNGTLNVTRNSSSNTTGVIRGWKFYVFDTDGAGGSDLFFNSFDVYRY